MPGTNFATIFDRTIEENICETSREKWGYIDARNIFIKMKVNPITYLIQLPTGFLGSYFGLPWFYTYMIEYEFTIYDSKKHKLKKYSIYKEETYWLNIFNGFPDGHTIKKLNIFHSLLRELETKINADASYINSELEKVGKIN